MKINHIISSIDKSSGGPARSVTHLIESVLKENSELEIVLDTLESDNPLINNFKAISGSINFHQFGLLHYSASLNSTLLILEVNLFHGHGLWQLPVHQMAKIARGRKIPYIITPRGMLEPWALEQGKLKKKLALILFQFKDLEKAICLHATSPMEVKTFRNLGFTNPIAMIPNGIDLKKLPKEVPHKQNNPRKILFLSRIHPKKGIENLIEAWSQLDNEIRKDWIVEVIGNGDESYINSLNRKVKDRQLNKEITIKPPVFGSDKIKLYREASLFVLPTFSENFGIVVAEALASYTPVITTKGAPWEDLETHHCGWWIDIGVQPLKKALETAIQTNESEVLKMGQNGRRLIEEKYSIDSVAIKMLELYDWILNKAEKPEFIHD